MEKDRDLATVISQGRFNISRRNFCGTLLAAAAGFMILPPASTYDRVWKVVQPPILLLPGGLFDWFSYTPDGMIHYVWDGKRNEKVRPASWDEYLALNQNGCTEAEWPRRRKLNIV